MKIGYMIVSHDIMVSGKAIGYLYREEPDNESDSGWRVFSGEETQEFADEPSNFSMYNASTVVEREPAIAELLGRDYPVAFEREAGTSSFVEVADEDDKR